MKKADFQQELLASDDFAQYSLRATFFVRKLRGMRLFEAIHEVHQLSKAKNSFVWTDSESWGVDSAALERISAKGLDPLHVFCHPRVITEQPRLLLYYRTLALISQKGLSTLIGGNIAAIESGKQQELNAEWTHKVAVTLNSILSAIVTTSADINASDLPGFQFASAGTTIQGAWNNAIGEEGEMTVRKILVNQLKDELLQIVWRDGSTTDYSASLHANLIDRIDEVRILRLNQGHHLRFSSEPDVSLRDQSDLPLVAIEVKAGTDAAGALERLGAAMKSFENDRNANPRVKTVYVVRCLTPELQKRISHNKPFDYTFGLLDLMNDAKTQRTFANLILRAVLGQRTG